MLKFLVMKIYSVTSDKQVNETVEMHDYFMKKYWPLADIIVLGYKEPEYKSDFVKFDSMGEDLGIKYQMKQIYEYFLKLDESHFIFCSTVLAGHVSRSDGSRKFWALPDDKIKTSVW